MRITGPVGAPAPPEGAEGRVEALLASMTIEEKLAQLVGLWVGADGESGEVAPFLHEMLPPIESVESFTRHGLGHLTRVFGSRPVAAAEGARSLARAQRRLVTSTRPGIPAIAHEECLTGLTAWGATTFPCPLAWGASWDPELVERMAAAIGESMRRIGVHQGLAPVLDVIRDPRWGRVEECIAEDPYLVGTVGTAYVRGLQSAGIIATLKHFAGYSGSRAGRNFAPVSAGPRELADVFLPPFEMAVREGGARSVMPAYTELDGVPAHADATLLTRLLRERWGFEGTVVSDYFGVTFLQTLHGVAGEAGEAAAAALAAGVDVELPTGAAYLAPLAAAVREGRVPEQLVDRAVRRVLRQKAELGLLDQDFDPDATADVDLDPPEHRAIARQLAEESVILLENSAGLLPLPPDLTRVAVVGCNADSPHALLGGYSFVNHVGVHHPGTPLGIRVPTVLEALREELGPGVTVLYEQGCGVRDGDGSGIAAAAELARGADLCVAVVGDRSGLFGRGTVGEGSDTDSLELPGVQRALVERCIDTGTPVVLVLVTGRPYAIGWARGRAAAIVQAFLPGEEGAAAIAGVLSGRVNPSGRLAVSVPRSAGAQPYTYLHPLLGAANDGTNLDTTPAFPFGYGLSYTSFAYSDLELSPASIPTDGVTQVACTVTNTGERAGAEVVQLYTRDLVASVTRPLRQLTGFARVTLEPGESARVTFTVAADRLGFTGRDLARIVEPGDVEVMIGASCEDVRLRGRLRLTGEPRTLGPDAKLVTGVRVAVSASARQG